MGNAARPTADEGESDADASDFRLAHDRPLAAAPRSRRPLYVFLLVAALAVTGAASAVFPGSETGQASIRIESDTPGLAVHVNGALAGQTPVTLGVEAGEHRFAVGPPALAVERLLRVWPGDRIAMYFSESPSASPSHPPAAPLPARTPVASDGGPAASRGVPAAGPGAGWLTVRAPLALDIREGARVVGTTASDAVMLPAGEHQLEFSDRATGFAVRRLVVVRPGATTSIAIEVPRATVNVNATPWAEVWVDEQHIGETPIGNYPLVIGSHRFELRHPEFGAKQITATVTLEGTNRISVDMRR